MGKCKHNWVFQSYGGDYEYFYCSKCLAEAKLDDNYKRNYIITEAIKDD